jgi:hypothetical protein
MEHRERPPRAQGFASQFRQFILRRKHSPAFFLGVGDWGAFVTRLHGPDVLSFPSSYNSGPELIVTRWDLLGRCGDLISDFRRD